VFCDKCIEAYHGVDSISIAHVRTDENTHYDIAVINLTED
jgi:hypothetical protein